MYTEELTQELSVADYLAPASVNAANVATTGVDMSKFKRVMYSINIGAITGVATVDAHLESAAASNFASPHNMTSTNITQVTNAGPNTIVTIETTDSQVAQQNAGDRYLRLKIVVGANAAVVGAVGLGGSAKHDPANAADVTAATQRLCLN